MAYQTATSEPKQTPAEIVTARVIAGLSEQKIPWRKTWSQRQTGCNFATGYRYQAGNALLCYILELEGKCSQLISFKQASDRNLQVRKGAKCERIIASGVFYKDMEGKPVNQNNFDPKKGHKKIPYQKMTAMFSADDILGADKNPVTPRGVQIRFAFDASKLSEVLQKTGIECDFAPGQQPAFSVTQNRLKMANPENFEAAGFVWRTFFHELVHATGHESRLNRKFGLSSDSPEYAFEELTAEIGSQMLVEHFQVAESETLEISQAYINHWVKNIQANPALVLSAAKSAQKAVDWVLERLGENANQSEPVED